MSGYDKYGTSDVNDFDARKSSSNWSSLNGYNASRPSQDSIYMSYPHADSQAHRNGDQMAYGTSTYYQPRANYEATSSHVGDTARKMPEVKSYDPQQGPSGCHVIVYLRSEYDLIDHTFSLMFASRRVPASLTRLETHGPAFEYAVASEAPSHSEIGDPNARVRLSMHLQDQSRQDIASVGVGYFEYTNGKIQSLPYDASRKRKHSPDLGPTDVPALQNSQSYDSYSFAPNGHSPYPSNLQTMDLNSMQRKFSPYGRAQNPQSLRSTPTRLMRPQMLQRASWSPSYSSTSQTMDVVPISSTSSPNPANPLLVRTSTLQQQTSPGSNASTPGNSFNPYSAIFPQKAILKIRGSLDSMTENWTPDEWSTKRRLVQFRRSQNKSVITAEFAPVAPEDRQPNSICISCILWEERQEFFATSVDTIYLLEQLVALRFTVEEKNRIRRNLEGFHPLTVSKAKADSEEFFKVIMGFPNPKPRNIEKDVKVFPWKILTHALKKIISKYSASYSSTAGALPQPRSSAYTGYQSPPPSSHSAASSAYGTLKSHTMSPQVSHNLYSEAPGSLPSLTEDFTIPSNYGSQDHLPSLRGSYEGGHYKRPRANTSDLYATHNSTSPLNHMSRSLSEDPNMRSLPSLHDTYAVPSSEPRYMTNDQAAAATLSQLPTGRNSYDFSNYIAASPASAQAENPQAVATTPSSQAPVAQEAN